MIREPREEERYEINWQQGSRFLDALASLVLMIETHWLTHSLTHSLTRRLEIDSPSDPSDLIHNIEIDNEWTN